MTHHRIRLLRWVSLVLLVLGLSVSALGGVDQPESATATAPTGMDSTTVAELQEKYSAQNSDAESGSTALVYLKSAEPLDLPVLKEVTCQWGEALIPSEDGTAALLPVTVNAGTASENAEEVEKLRADINAEMPAGVSAQATGPAAIQADLAGVFEGANFLLLGVTAAIVAFLLIVTYRSPILWILPLAVIGVADRTAATAFTYVLDAFGLSWNESTAGILSVLVFGAGTNYALLLISRYRDELTGTADRFTAMARAWTPTAKTVSASAATVIVGVACLRLSSVPTTQGLGAAALVGISIAWLFALFALPGFLALFGRWIFWPRIPREDDTPNHGVWAKVGSWVRQRPRKVVAVALLVLGICCTGYFQTNTGLTQSEQFIDTPESITAAEELSRDFPDQSATPPVVATQDVELTQEQLQQMGASGREQGSVDGWTLLQVSGADFQELRGELDGVLVGGPDAELADAETAAADDRQLIFPLVLVLIFVALVVMLRALVAPAIMIASVLLTNIAALGLGWWVSHYLLGFNNFDSTTPLYAFVFLVALGVDYTIFLVTRAREDSAKEGTASGIYTALAATGGVITSAGILLAAVFAALGVLPLVVLAQIGVIVCIGVLLDTLIVRTLVVPAVVQLLDERFWWPARPAKNASGQSPAPSPTNDADGFARPVSDSSD